MFPSATNFSIALVVLALRLGIAPRAEAQGEPMPPVTSAALQPGDFVMMQFGHNDGGPLDDASRARGSLKGTGEETKEIENPILKKHEVLHTYGWYLREYISETRDAQARPLVCTPIPRKIFREGKIPRNDGYAAWAREVAAQQMAPLLDLAEVIAQRYDALGPERVEPLFADEHTHTSKAGAELNALCVVAALRVLPAHPLAALLL